MAGAAVAARPGRRAAPTDHQLVGAARRGDDRAFEQLYSRYQRRIAAYVCGMVKDYGRAEDITQEVFVSALRRIRQTERPIAFKPWVYEIAKNACIDSYRRARRAEEISYDADDRLSPSDYGRLVATGLEPDAAVDAKQELDHLCGAFGGLSESHHQILVMRELEGLSYREIGERMGLSRPAVESTLFRARKRLGEEYDELASGARCLRIQALIADGGAHLGLRDQRRLARHISHCQPCRRLAARAGLEVPVPARRRVPAKVAAWLPLPAFLRLRRTGGGEEAASALGGGGTAWMAQASGFADSFSSGWSKAVAALAALLVAGAGVGVTTDRSGGVRDERGTGDRTTQERTAAAPGSPVTARHAPGARRGSAADADRGARRGAKRDGAKASRPVSAGRPGAGSSGAGAPAQGGGSGPADGPALSSPTASVPKTEAPRLQAPVSAPDVDESVDTVTSTLPDVQQTVETTASQLPVPAPDPEQAVTDVTAAAGDAVDGAGGLIP